MNATTPSKLTCGQTAEFLGVSNKTISEWIKRKWLTAPKRIGNRKLFTLAVVRRDCERNCLPVALPLTDGEWPADVC
jgi:excisionase family DNA binding protein